MEAFSASLAICEGNPPVTGGSPSQRPVAGSFDVFFDLRLNKRLSKQSRRRWLETLSGSLWRHCNKLCWNRADAACVDCKRIHIGQDHMLCATRTPVAPFTNMLNWTSCLTNIRDSCDSRRHDAHVVMPWNRIKPRWRHQMETFSALLTICAGNSPVTGEFHTQRSVTRSFDVFFDLSLNKRLSKQSWGWWFETPSRPLRRHRNAEIFSYYIPYDYM